eukprot:INCI20248.1.p1 GENE.INCI20248.1~~INCI20248.1.p1  ORF type:complete len:421 (-),score=84.63 INCI20248.1:454-1716(-)
MKLSEVKRLTVAKLRAALKTHGEAQNGLKAELVQRLWDVMNQKQQQQQQPTSGEHAETTVSSSASSASPSSSSVAADDAPRVVTVTSGDVQVVATPSTSSASSSSASASASASSSVGKQGSAIPPTKAAADSGEIEASNGNASANDGDGDNLASGVSSSSQPSSAKRRASSSNSLQMTKRRLVNKDDGEQQKQSSRSDEVVMERSAEEGEEAEQDSDLPRTVRVLGLVRPFRTPDLKMHLGSFGDIADFWIDRIKSTCIVTFSSSAEARAAAEQLDGKTWPERNKESVLRAEVVQESQHRGLSASALAARLYGSSTVSQSRSIPGSRSSATGGVSASAQGHGDTAGSKRSDNHHGARSSGPSLDQLFTRTKAKPALFWKPISKVEIMRRRLVMAREAREAANASTATSKRRPRSRSRERR